MKYGINEINEVRKEDLRRMKKCIPGLPGFFYGEDTEILKERLRDIRILFQDLRKPLSDNLISRRMIRELAEEILALHDSLIDIAKTFLEEKKFEKKKAKKAKEEIEDKYKRELAKFDFLPIGGHSSAYNNAFYLGRVKQVKEARILLNEKEEHYRVTQKIASGQEKNQFVTELEKIIFLSE